MKIKTDDLYRRFCLYTGQMGEAPGQLCHTVRLRERFEAHLPEAAAEVAREIPREWFDTPGNFADAPLEHDGAGTGRVLLPDDFMRLLSFRLEGWACAVRQDTAPASLGYRLQRQPVVALRATSARPLCAVVPHPCGLALEFYSTVTEPVVAEALYVPWPRADRDGSIELPRLAVPLVVRRLAEALGVSP